MAVVVVTMEDMRRALDAFGIEKDGILLTHSSLKALGHIQGGPEAVIQAIEDTVPQGTVVFPTLSQKNFHTALEDWTMDRPSDVGVITETFRLQPGSLRSDNPTHSVAARGKHAEDLVSGHATGRGRYSPFCDLSFGYESPWQRIFDSNTRYGVPSYALMWGVSTARNTLKHFAEHRSVERLLSAIPDGEKRRAMTLELKHNPPVAPPEGVEQIYPFFKARLVEPMLFERGIARRVALGQGSLILCHVQTMVLFMEDMLENHPEQIIEDPKVADWFLRAKKYAGEKV